MRAPLGRGVGAGVRAQGGLCGGAGGGEGRGRRGGARTPGPARPEGGEPFPPHTPSGSPRSLCPKNEVSEGVDPPPPPLHGGKGCFSAEKRGWWPALTMSPAAWSRGSRVSDEIKQRRLGFVELTCVSVFPVLPVLCVRVQFPSHVRAHTICVFTHAWRPARPDRAPDPPHPGPWASVPPPAPGPAFWSRHPPVPRPWPCCGKVTPSAAGGLAPRSVREGGQTLVPAVRVPASEEPAAPPDSPDPSRAQRVGRNRASASRRVPHAARPVPPEVRAHTRARRCVPAAVQPGG